MTEKIKEDLVMEGAAPQVSVEAAERILYNVFRACDMPLNMVPFKELAEKYKGEREKEQPDISKSMAK